MTSRSSSLFIRLPPKAPVSFTLRTLRLLRARRWRTISALSRFVKSQVGPVRFAPGLVVSRSAGSSEQVSSLQKSPVRPPG